VSLFQFSSDEPAKAAPAESSQPVVEKSAEEIRIDEINMMLVKLDKMIDKIQTEAIKPVTSKLEELDASLKTENQKHSQTKEEKQQEYLKMVAELDAKHAEETKALKQAQQENRLNLYAAQDQLTDVKNELAKLSKEQKQLQSALAAQKTMEQLELKLNTFLSEFYQFSPLDEDSGEPLHLMPFQNEDLMVMIGSYEAGRSGVLNANDMGLGKTLESIVFDFCVRQLFYEKEGRQPRVLWLTKSSLIKGTVREFRKWNPNRAIMPVMGKWNKDQREFTLNMGLEQNAIVITNYEVLNSTPSIMDIEWDFVYCDEVHKLKGGHKSTPTQVWVNVKEVVKKAKFFVPMSGSPIQNEPGEMWSYLHIFDPIRFPTAARFKREYCYGWGEGMKVDFEQLIKVMGKQVLRHSKDDVLKDLPDKTREFRLLEMTPKQREIYDQMKNNFFIYLDEAGEKKVDATVTIAYINRLRQLALYPASVVLKGTDGEDTIAVDCKESCVLDEAMELTEELINEGERVVIFSAQYLPPLYGMKERIEDTLSDKMFTVMDKDGVATYPVKCAVIDASTKDYHDEYVTKYNKGEIQILLINMTVGGEGLNLQKGSHAIFLDRWWNPMSNMQAEDRLHRKGQKNAVTIHVLDVEDSAYQFVQQKIEMKAQMIDDIMEDASLRKTGKELKSYLQGLL